MKEALQPSVLDWICRHQFILVDSVYEVQGHLGKAVELSA